MEDREGRFLRNIDNGLPYFTVLVPGSTNQVGFEVLTSVSVKRSPILWDKPPCIQTEVNRQSGGTELCLLPADLLLRFHPEDGGDVSCIFTGIHCMYFPVFHSIIHKCV
jgi:hypothetical protein